MRNALRKIIIGVVLAVTVEFIIMAFFLESVKPKFMYCELVFADKLLSNQITVASIYDRDPGFSKDYRIKEIPISKTFDSIEAAMDSMKLDGWEPSLIFLSNIDSTHTYRWKFRKPVE